jgi:hypothetical protein
VRASILTRCRTTRGPVTRAATTSPSRP